MKDLQRWLPCLVVLLSLWATYAHVETRWVNRWDFPEATRHAEPLDPEVLYFAFYSKAEAYRSDPELAVLIRPGNMPMLAGVKMVNGYSPVHPGGFSSVLEIGSQVGFYTHEAPALRILEYETGPDGLLELMGVDGLVLAGDWQDHATALLEKGWETIYTSKAGMVLHRVGRRDRTVRSLPSAELVTSREEIPRRIRERSAMAVPRLLARPDSAAGIVEYASCKLEIENSSRHRVDVRVESLSAQRPSLVVFARPWYPGYRASLDGRPLRVEALNLIQLAVELPPGSEGLLVLEYSPATLRIGLGIALLALLIGAGMVVASTLQRRRKEEVARALDLERRLNDEES